jgi:hypothetical protein
MPLIRFTYGSRILFVASEQVTHLMDAGAETEIHMTGGEAVKVDGNLESVALRLQADRNTRDQI